MINSERYCTDTNSMTDVELPYEAMKIMNMMNFHLTKHDLLLTLFFIYLSWYLEGLVIVNKNVIYYKLASISIPLINKYKLYL